MGEGKELMFTDKNAAIRLSKAVSFWVIEHAPDFSLVEGWKLWVRRLAFVLLFVLMTGWLFMEGVTVYGIIVRTLLLCLGASVIYAHTIASAVYIFLCLWEEKGMGSDKFDFLDAFSAAMDDPKALKKAKP